MEKLKKYKVILITLISIEVILTILTFAILPGNKMVSNIWGVSVFFAFAIVFYMVYKNDEFYDEFRTNMIEQADRELKTIYGNSIKCTKGALSENEKENSVICNNKEPRVLYEVTDYIYNVNILYRGLVTYKNEFKEWHNKQDGSITSKYVDVEYFKGHNIKCNTCTEYGNVVLVNSNFINKTQIDLEKQGYYLCQNILNDIMVYVKSDISDEILNKLHNFFEIASKHFDTHDICILTDGTYLQLFIQDYQVVKLNIVDNVNKVLKYVQLVSKNV